MTFKYKDNSAIDAVFYDLRDYQTCTVSVVPLVKKSVRAKHRQAYVTDKGSEEEN